MGDDEFYITLPCNSSRSVYPDNEISNYRTKLSRPLILKGVVVKLLDLDPQGRRFDPWCGHDKICTAVGHLS